MVIVHFRKRHGLTQVELAKDWDIAQGTLSKIEKGYAVPSIHQWYVFCEMYDVPKYMRLLQ